MPLRVGKNDRFERLYMGLFNNLASKHGEFVKYERDRGARDIGLHFTQVKKDGSERMSQTLVWFQLKGIMTSTLNKKDYAKHDFISIQIQINHLKFWHIQPDTTYIVLYVECSGHFLYLNTKNYIKKHLGDKIFSMTTQKPTIKFPKKNILTHDVFRAILQKHEVLNWAKVLKSDERQMRTLMRDYEILYRISTAKEKNRDNRVVFIDWSSKMRGEVHFQEREKNKTVGSKKRVLGFVYGIEEGWENYREHWQYGLSIDCIEETFPYLRFKNYNGHIDPDDDWWIYSDDSSDIFYQLSDGTLIEGENCAFEYFKYELKVELNEVGHIFWSWFTALQQIGILELGNEDNSESKWVSIAPWNYHDV